MTRDEAVAKLRAVKDRGDYTFKSTISAHGFVDGLVALGLLTLSEPESVLAKFERAIDGFGSLKGHNGKSLMSWIEAEGLRVVPA